METNTEIFRSPLEKSICIPNAKSKCTWTKDGASEPSPHTKWDWRPNQLKILPNILAAIGNTPMVKLNRIPESEAIKCDIYVKCEFLNPAGSVKDRMVLRFIEDGERSGVVKPGTTFIEASSGNTGIGLAWASAIKGYRCIIVMADKISQEKEAVIRALGGEVVRVSTDIPLDAPDGIYGRVHLLHKEIPGSVVLDQFSNPANPLMHYDTTAEEIYDQCDGQVDMIVMGCGTGGTLTGVSRKFKELSPHTKIIGADPYGSTFAEPATLNETDIKFIEIEGVGYDLQATVCDRSMVDKWYKLYDKESLNMSRRLIKEEGLLVGGSSGVLMAGAIKAIKEFKIGKGKRVVVLLPDGTKSYLTKFVREQWMEQRGFMDCVNSQNHWWWDIKLTDLNYGPSTNVTTDQTLAEVLAIMDNFSVDYLPVTEKNGNVAGLVVRKKIINKLIFNEENSKEPITTVTDRIFSKLPISSNLGLVSRCLEIEDYVVILDSQGEIEKPIGVLTSEDVLRIIRTKK